MIKFSVGDVVKSQTCNWMSQDAIEAHRDVQKGIPGEIISIDLSGGTAVVLVYTRFMHEWLVREGLSYDWFRLGEDKTKYKHVLTEMKLDDLVLSQEPIPEPTIEDLVEEAFPRSGSIAVFEIYAPRNPLEPGKLCHFKECTVGLQRHRSVLNVLGLVYVPYSCDACHVKYNGRRFESLPDLKDSL
jgi:hypothetical protein